MKYIKSYENVTKHKAEITHADIRECSEIIQRKAGITQSNGFDHWTTHNWCFNHSQDEEFFCRYYFHVIIKSLANTLLRKYLLANNIKFEISGSINDYKNDSIIISFDITKEQILYYLIEEDYPFLTEEEINSEIDSLLEEERIRKTQNKYNL